MSLYHTIYLDDAELLELELKYTYYPGHPGTFYARNGDPGDPPEGAEVNIERATLIFGDYTFDLSDFHKWPTNLLDRIEEKLLEAGEEASLED